MRTRQGDRLEKVGLEVKSLEEGFGGREEMVGSGMEESKEMMGQVLKGRMPPETLEQHPVFRKIVKQCRYVPKLQGFAGVSEKADLMAIRFRRAARCLGLRSRWCAALFDRSSLENPRADAPSPHCAQLTIMDADRQVFVRLSEEKSSI